MKSDLGLHCLPMYHKKDTRLMLVKYCLLIIFAIVLGPDKARQNVWLIWIQTVCTLMVETTHSVASDLIYIVCLCPTKTIVNS